MTIIGVQAFAETDALVQTKIVQPDGTSAELGLRVRGAEEQMKIIDVVVGGVSVELTERREFASVVQQTGIDGLSGTLRSRVNGLQQAEPTQD